MILDNLKQIVQKEKGGNTNPLYIRSLLKEYLQDYFLFYIYTNEPYRSKAIFTGGTCLRQFFGLPRLSEDLDFDYLKKFDTSILCRDLKNFFYQQYQYQPVEITVKQRGKQILAKFSGLRSLGLAGLSESDLLYVKLDFAENKSKIFETEVSSKSEFDFNFVAKHYDLATLMANKINAIFYRQIFEGEKDRLTIKGRDYFDLLWFLKKGTKPNIKRLQDLWREPGLSFLLLKKRLWKKVIEIDQKYLTDFENDLLPFLRNPEALKDYAANYKNEIKPYLFGNRRTAE